jgi:outer membrane murein-binding lipoprotein Lpp
MPTSSRPVLLTLAAALILASLLLSGCSRGNRLNGNLSSSGAESPAQQQKSLPTLQPTSTSPSQALKPSATRLPEATAVNPLPAQPLSAEDSQALDDLDKVLSNL